MAVPQYRPLQTTATTGTGTLTLDAAASNVRSFQDAFGSSSVKVRYVIAWASGYEIGVGTYNGASPGTLTRDTVIASSNAGALVTLSAGTKDVFVSPDFDRPINSISGGTTLAIADLGNLVAFTGASSATINLPAVSTVPPGAGFVVRNAGTSGACITLDGNGSETIDGATTLVIAPGETAEIFRVASAWLTVGLSSGFVTIRRQTTTGSTPNINFLLPSGFEAFKVVFRGLGPASGTPDLVARLSTDGGSSYLSGGSDYAWGGLFLDAVNAPAGAADSTDSHIRLHSAIGATSGEIDIYGARDATFKTAMRCFSAPVRSGINYGSEIFGGLAVAAADHNAVQILNSDVVNFNAGGILTLMGLR
jgi:hypothetical protein